MKVSIYELAAFLRGILHLPGDMSVTNLLAIKELMGLENKRTNFEFHRTMRVRLSTKSKMPSYFVLVFLFLLQLTIHQRMRS